MEIACPPRIRLLIRGIVWQVISRGVLDLDERKGPEFSGCGIAAGIVCLRLAVEMLEMGDTPVRNAFPGSTSSFLRLHLGCGRKVIPGYLGVDAVNLPTADVVWDLNKRPWPWSDGSVEAIVTEHTLEHLDDTVATMEEIWRVCRHGARVHIVVPYALSLGALQDPTHRRYFTEQTFRYFTADSRWNFYTHARFEILGYDFRWFSGGLQDLRNIIPRPIRRMLRFFVFTMVDELVIDLRVVKK